jgi:hypothetical protein
VRPLIVSPPKLPPPPKKCTIPKRSIQVATQPLTHILTSKRGEVLLMKKMGILPLAAPVLSAAQNMYDTIFARNLSSEQVGALDKLFPIIKPWGLGVRVALQWDVKVIG